MAFTQPVYLLPGLHYLGSWVVLTFLHLHLASSTAV